VRGEESTGAVCFLEMFDDGPGDRKAVECGGAAADFIEEHEARRRRVIENASDFGHFDEKCGTAACEIVAGADAREDAVGDGKFGLARGNERAHLREKNDESGLAKIGGFTACWVR